MRVIIPTYRRVDAQATFAALPPEWKAKTDFYVDQTDADKLARRGILREGTRVFVVPEDVKTIAQKRAHIIRTTDQERILMMDDDLTFAHRRDGSGTKLFPSTEKEVGALMGCVEDMLNVFAHVGISPRQGNNNFAEDTAENTRMIYALGYQIPVLRTCELGRIEHREDMDYTLQLLRRGYENRVIFDSCVNQAYNSLGGASLERTVEGSNADAERLAELHPGLVKVVEKAYKVSVPRKEVICYWKKAIEQGRLSNAGT